MLAVRLVRTFTLRTLDLQEKQEKKKQQYGLRDSFMPQRYEEATLNQLFPKCCIYWYFYTWKNMATILKFGVVTEIKKWDFLWVSNGLVTDTDIHALLKI